jgi:HlyD family secretion protein
MNKSTPTMLITIALAGATGLWWYQRAGDGDGTAYRFATIERSNLESTVSATGTLNAVTTVQVGTQVSGLVTAILTDFNQTVKKGQLLARIDPTLLEQTVRDAQAGLERTNAELTQAQRDYDRNKQLHDRQVLTQSEFDGAEYRLAVASANVKSAQVKLDRAERNLVYSRIYAPIDGVVIERNVDVGQTVAASVSAPQLFLIANDLSQMEILASVDESDIGAIHEEQDVRFTVQPYPNEKFTGKVRQVRLQSTTVENVVNYTAVVSVDNSSGRLLPGMTATADFITGSADSALVVVNSALRFRPTDDQLASIAAIAAANPDTARIRAPGSDSLVTRAVNRAGGVAGAGAAATGATSGRATAARGAGTQGGRGGASGSTLWYLNENGELASLRVRTGLTNGQQTVVQGPGLQAGMQIIIAASTTAGSSNTSSSPFQTSTAQQGGGPPRQGF